MNKILFIFIFIGSLFCYNGYSQTITLTQEQFNDLTNNINNKNINVRDSSKYVSWGKEIGIAIDETLKAIGNNAIKISETKVGKVAIGISLFKLLAKDILCIFFSIVSLIVIIMFLCKLIKFTKEIRNDYLKDYGKNQSYNNVTPLTSPDLTRLCVLIAFSLIFLFIFIGTLTAI